MQGIFQNKIEYCINITVASNFYFPRKKYACTHWCDRKMQQYFF